MLILPSLREQLINRLCTHWLHLVISALTVVLAVMVVYSSESLRSAIAISGDEGFEVTKAALWAKGYRLYEDIWNNQPPVHTVLLGLLFKLFGPSIAIARSLAICFGILLVAGVFVTMKERYGLLSAYAAVVSLLTSPEVLKLSLAAMLEVPAIGVAVWAYYAAERWACRRQLPYLLASAGLIAIALQIKLTAAVVVPAVATEIFLTARGQTWLKRLHDCALHLCMWALVVVVFLLAIAFALGGSYEQMVASLFSPQLLDYVRAQEQLAWSGWDLRQHKEALLAVPIALGFTVVRRDWRRIAPILVFLLTVVLVHSLRRPYWSYYYLHFAVPLALLTGYALGESARAALQWRREMGLRSHLAAAAGLVISLVLGWRIITLGGARVTEEIDRISCLPRVDDEELITVMRAYRDRTRWVYSRDTVCTFHAGVSLIPWLAVLPDNRFWSGRISWDEILETIRLNKPEQLLLVEELDAQGKAALELDYVEVFEDQHHSLYVLRSLIMRDPMPLAH